MNSLSRGTKFFWVLLVITITIQFTFRIEAEKPLSDWSFIGSDGIGYYAYLPAIFIDGDLHDLTPSDRNRTREVNDRIVLKYTAGTALLMLPFFALAALISALSGFPIDGFSFPFQISIAFAGLFYLFSGLILIERALRFLDVNRFARYSTIACLLFGTNLLYYAAAEPSMSHVYSFVAIAGFILSLLKWQQNPHYTYLLSLLFCLSIAILIRPVNAITILFIPALVPLKALPQLLKTTFMGNRVGLGFSLFLPLMVLSIQPCLWYMQSDSFFLWTYPGEGFDFSKPEIFNSLFGFRKGLFIYTPVLLFSLPGLYFMWLQNRWMALFFLLGSGVLIFVNSSWWNWYFADSFGLRGYLDYYALFAIPMAFFFQAVKGRLSLMITTVVAALLVALNLIQSYQYMHRILDHSQMNFEKYKYVFLSVSEEKERVLGGRMEVPPFSISGPEKIFQSGINFDNVPEYWYLANQGDYSGGCRELSDKCFVYHENEYGPMLALPGEIFMPQSGQLFLNVSLRKMETDVQIPLSAKLAVNYEGIDRRSHYFMAVRLNDMPEDQACKWRSRQYQFSIPVIEEDVQLKVFIENPDQQEFLIDDFQVTIYHYP